MAGQQGGHDPKEAALAAARCLNPHPEQVTDPEFLGSDSSTPGTRCRSSTRWCARLGPAPPVTEATAAFGYSGPRTTPRPPRWNRRGWKGWCPPGPGRAAPTS